ncbi:keratin, type I cytoskeletal 18 [Silurus meridionalis]|uniref:keratin, type I cytoskeletal 18 n=1 Tax=Silurus meridionalis TaxID=175797 RepID=UPI001EEAA360|nr:keratin, type I cytoskeletal 18 [Silurus meridionalis]
MSREVRASSLSAEARLGHARSPLRFSAPFNGTGDAMHPGEEKETMRGLNERLADYLCQVRLLEEANSRLEAQIKEVLTEKRAAGQRDWSGYERTISTLKDQIKEMIMDNARILLQLDNGKLAADDFKVKFEAEFAVRGAVEEDITKLRKMIDDTHISSMQLESHIEILTEELIYLKKNHEEDVASIKGQIKNSSVDVQMEAAKGQDLSETIDNIRKQYDKAVQKNREETEAWYQNKFENISAEVSRNTDALQQGKSELNELRRQKQGLEIELQGMHSMKHSLEDTLNETLGRYSQNVNSHNRVIQQLEVELADVHAQVMRQGAEYQALLNIKSKLEEEIATYHGLLEGIGLPSNYMGDSELDEDGDFRGMGAREELDIKDVVPPEDGDVNDKGTFEDGNVGGNGGFDESVEFSLEQALNAAPRILNPDPTLNNKIVEEQIVSEKDLELNAANTAMNKQHDQEEDGREIKEDQVILGEMVKRRP